MTDIRWNPALAAHKEFPVQLIEGAYIYGDDKRRELRAGSVISEGWGVTSGIAVMGPSSAPMPNTLDVTYLSYAEDRFYSGRVPLPQSKLAELFKGGFSHQGTGAQGSYKWLIAGLGGGGQGTIWVSGDQHVHAVMDFQLDEQDTDWDSVMSSFAQSRPDFVSAALEAFEAKPVLDGAAARFQRLSQRYTWTPEIISAGPVGEAKVAYFNGEQEIFNFMRPITFRDALAAPKMLFLTWATEAGEGYGAEVFFDEVETLSAFEAVGSDTQGRMRLEVRISKLNRALHFIVRDNARLIQLENVKVSTFRNK